MSMPLDVPSVRRQTRIEKSQASGTLFEAVSVTRNIDMAAEREKMEETRAAAAAAVRRAEETRMNAAASRYASPVSSR